MSTPRVSCTAVVHPLVLLNISEHTTRTLAQVKGGKAEAPPFLCGAVLGRQTGNNFEMFLSFELKLNAAGGDFTQVELDLEHFTIRLEQLKIIFPEHDFIGWYAVGAEQRVSPAAARLHERIIDNHPSALLMVFDAALADGAARETSGGGFSLPITVYETLPPGRVDRSKVLWYKSTGAAAADGEYYVESTADRSGQGEAGLVWASRLVPMQVELDSGEAERVAVEHVANVSRVTSDEMLDGTAGDASAESSEAPRMATFLASQRNALEMLTRDIAVLKTYVGDVISERAEFDPDVLQLVQRVLSNKPVVLDDAMFDLAMAQEETNFQLTSYLAGITNAASVVRSVSQRSNAALVYARNKHGPFINPNQGDSMFGAGMGGMMPSFGGHGRLGRRGFGAFR
ncbi:hypothetical protein GGF46_004111 [Coemansia sp. RSA 552]|nr:hypothetical protein GGF46_004111 [Coemansia sp. RSA 552]